MAGAGIAGWIGFGSGGGVVRAETIVAAADGGRAMGETAAGAQRGSISSTSKGRERRTIDSGMIGPFPKTPQASLRACGLKQSTRCHSFSYCAIFADSPDHW